MIPDHNSRLGEAYRSMTVATAHLNAGLAPSAVVFATSAAEAAVRQVYILRFDRDPEPDMGMSRMVRLISGYPGPFPDTCIAMLEVYAVQCQHPSSLSALLDEMSGELAGEIISLCQEVLAWADRELKTRIESKSLLPSMHNDRYE